IEAIRCKSSSQVSSQVMISVGLRLILLVVGASTENAIKKYQSSFAQELGEYEFCVKMIVACDKLRDTFDPPSDEDEFEENQATIDAALEKYRECFPKGLSLDGLRSYWNLVDKWESQVHELFLLDNLFGVAEVREHGQQMMVNFGKRQGWCPLYDEPPETTTTTPTISDDDYSDEETSSLNPEPVTTSKNKNKGGSVGNIKDSCKVPSDFDRWVHNEIDGIRNMSSLTERFFDFEKLLGKYSSHSCCPYKSISDRVEVINDGIDILEDLQDLKPYKKNDYTDKKSDFHNLNRRLKHLRSGNGIYSSEKCCPDCSEQFKSFQNTFQSNLKDFNPPQSNITLKDLLKNVTSLEDTCSQQQNQLQKTLYGLNHKRYNSEKTCCGDEENKMKLIEDSLKDMQTKNSQKDISEKVNSLRAKLEKSTKALSDTENMLGLEAKEIEKLKKECEKVSRIQATKTLIDGLSSNVSKLVNKLSDMESERTVDIPKLNALVDSLKNENNKFTGINTRTATSNNEKHKQDIDNLKKTLKNVNLKYSNFHVYHELYQVAVKQILEKYQKQHDDLKKSVKASEPSFRSKVGETLKPVMNKLEEDLVDLKDTALPQLAQDIRDRKKDTAGKVEEKDQQEITWFNEEVKRKKDQILQRLDRLNQNKDPEKVRQLEAHILQLSDRLASLAKKVADRHEVLEQNGNELNKRIAAASSAAASCPNDCDLGDLPTMDSIANRVKVLEQQLQS
ncbi:hypothetical protein KR059_004002, partial [Drosophila kikkawai]